MIYRANSVIPVHTPLTRTHACDGRQTDLSLRGWAFSHAAHLGMQWQCRSSSAITIPNVAIAVWRKEVKLKRRRDKQEQNDKAYLLLDI